MRKDGRGCAMRLASFLFEKEGLCRRDAHHELAKQIETIGNRMGEILALRAHNLLALRAKSVRLPEMPVGRYTDLIGRAMQTVRIPISRICRDFAGFANREIHESSFGKKEKTP